MYEPVGHIFESELSATGSQIAFAVPVTLQVSIYCAHQRKASDVELSVFVKQGLLDVLLYNIRPLDAIHGGVLNKTLNVIKLLAHLNAATSIRILSWLHNPKVLAELWKLVQHCFLVWICSIFVQLLKFQELGIVQSFFDVESER